MGAAIATVFSQGLSAFYVIYICFGIHLTATSSEIEGSCRAGPYLIGDGGSDGIAIFYYRYWQYHVAERQ